MCAHQSADGREFMVIFPILHVSCHFQVLRPVPLESYPVHQEARMSNNSQHQFDPFGWAEMLLSVRLSRLLGRFLVISILILFLVHRFLRYGTYLFKPLWVVETLIFVVFIITYATRRAAIDHARGIREIFVPLVGAALPFVLLLTPPLALIAGNMSALRIMFSAMTVTTALTVWGLWSVRKSFSITVEARQLVKGGVFRWIRHPVYLGEILTAGVVVVWRFSILNVSVFIVFVVVQLLRARWEETKLSSIFPDYRAYARKTWWLWRY
jgi:protein-S-isoprenylcysteine O-methyltransferase Ste14